MRASYMKHFAKFLAILRVVRFSIIFGSPQMQIIYEAKIYDEAKIKK